jgi:hypothetical protein
MSRLLFLVSAGALTVFYYYFFGAGPTASDYMDDLEWWRPWGTLMRDLHFAGLAQMARAGFPQAWVPILLGFAPALALCAAGWRVMRGALGRALLFFFAVMMCSFVYYGLRLETIWRFLEWRFALVFGAFTAVITALLFAPSLFDAALARSRVLAAALALAAVAGIFLLSTEVTGTDLEMAYNVSPWPFITLIGFLFLGALIASLHLASGAAVWLQARLGRGVGIALGLVTAAVVGWLAGRSAFGAPGLRVVTALLAIAVTGALIFRTRRDADRGARRGLVRVAVGALLLAAIMGSDAAANAMQRRARDVTAVRVLEALEAYKKDNATYPDSLDDLIPKYLTEIPRPPIGLIRDEGDRFVYLNYGDSYALEFASVLWVQCQYSPPYEFAASEPGDDAEDHAAPEKGGEPGDLPDVGSRKSAEDDAAARATLAQHGLNGSWSCPQEPPKLW